MTNWAACCLTQAPKLTLPTRQRDVQTAVGPKRLQKISCHRRDKYISTSRLKITSLEHQILTSPSNG